MEGLRFWSRDGGGHDQLIQLTEGVLVHEELSDRRAVEAAVTRFPARMVYEVAPSGFRMGASWQRRPGERLTGLGARHGLDYDQTGRRVELGADRRYTGPDCPPDMLDVGGIPQGDYAPAPWLLSNRGYAVWVETYGPGVVFELGEEVSVSVRAASGPLRLHVLLDPTPAARLRHYCRLTGFPALLPEWGYGHWKSRDVYEHQDDVLDDFHGYERHALPLDAIVIDSPWETQYNTWEFNPSQFPDARGTIARMRAAGVRTVVWVTPWVNLESVDGQRPPGEESERLHREPAPNYEEGARAGHFVRSAPPEPGASAPGGGASAPGGGAPPPGGGAPTPFVTRWWMGTGSPVDFTSPSADDWWRAQARRVLELGVEGIKADDGEGYYLPPDVRFADGRSGAEAAWELGSLYRASMQRALDEVHPGRGVLFGRSGWSGQQRHGMLWGGDQASDFWSLRTLVAATLTAAASGFSNWSHDVGGYLGWRLVERCPKELLLRWVAFGCFTPLMQAHGRFRQEAWTYDEETLAAYRAFVLLHERLVPYVRAAAATAARTGLPIVRPLCLTDPGDPAGWTIADSYGYGPALWVAPVLEERARSRDVYLPRGGWIDFWSGDRVRGGREIAADAPLDRIPVWVRAGSLLVTYPADHVAAGLGDVDERDRPLEATLWGEPPLGRAAARLADGTTVRWHHGAWSVTPDRDVAFAHG